jgi:hypothetical protein
MDISIFQLDAFGEEKEMEGGELLALQPLLSLKKGT